MLRNVTLTPTMAGGNEGGSTTSKADAADIPITLMDSLSAKLKSRREDIYGGTLFIDFVREVQTVLLLISHASHALDA